MRSLPKLITDFSPGLPSLFSNLDTIIDPDCQPALFGTNNFDALLKLTWSASRHCLNQIGHSVFTKCELVVKLLAPIIW